MDAYRWRHHRGWQACVRSSVLFHGKRRISVTLDDEFDFKTARHHRLYAEYANLSNKQDCTLPA